MEIFHYKLRGITKFMIKSESKIKINSVVDLYEGFKNDKAPRVIYLKFIYI